MNVLLTGGVGYIGSHTAVALSQAGHKIFLLDNLSNASEAVLEKLARINGRHSPFFKGDVREIHLVRNILASNSIDAVIHFAGLKAVGESVAKPIDYFSNNVQGTICLLEAMRTQSVRTLVFSSSATVYGHPKYLPLDENHPTVATNPYGRCKIHIEEILRDVATSDPDWRIACLRYFNPVGAHESALIGEGTSGVPNNLMPYIAQVALKQRRQLSVFGSDYSTPDGTGVRDYIHVMDLAEGHTAALSFLKKNIGWHAVNLGTGRGYSVLDMVRAFEIASGQKVPYRLTDRRPGDVAECYANPEKALKLFGWVAKRTLEDMCASMWRFQRSV